MTSNKAFMDERDDSDVPRGTEENILIRLPIPVQQDNRVELPFPTQHGQNERVKTSRVFQSEPTVSCGSDSSDTTNGTITIDVGDKKETCEDGSKREIVNCNLPVQEAVWQQKLDEVHEAVVGKTASSGKNYVNVPIEHVKVLKKGSEGSSVSKYRFKSEYGKSEYREIAGKKMLKDYYPNIKNEVTRVAKNSHHVNIAGYVTHHEEEEFVILFTELCDFSLKEYISKTITVEESDCPDSMKILGEAVQGIKYLHGLNVSHMDIKPGNFLFKQHTPETGMCCYVLKVIDFGLSKQLDSDRTATVSHDVVGTKSYMAPEQFKDHFKPTLKADVF
uniref:Protein kinase domain-containing protein n=3 Tax=Ciona intestinalis TaxID=7719 RepID=F6V3E7_CIOIN